jgi:hypothetical protein
MGGNRLLSPAKGYDNKTVSISFAVRILHTYILLWNYSVWTTLFRGSTKEHEHCHHACDAHIAVEGSH